MTDGPFDFWRARYLSDLSESEARVAFESVRSGTSPENWRARYGFGLCSQDEVLAAMADAREIQKRRGMPERLAFLDEAPTVSQPSPVPSLDDFDPFEGMPFAAADIPDMRVKADESLSIPDPRPTYAFRVGDVVIVTRQYSAHSGMIGYVTGVAREDERDDGYTIDVELPRGDTSLNLAFRPDDLEPVIEPTGPEPGSAPNGNPKDAVGSAKLRFGVLPWNALAGPALALTDGALKYGRHNWRRSDIRAEVYFDAALRHLSAWWEGEDLAPDSGMHHVDHAIAGLLILRDSMLRGSLIDDRPPITPGPWTAEANAAAARLREGRTEVAPPATEKEQ